MKKIIMTLIVLSMAIPMTLMAGDKEDIVKQIKQQWVDFSNKTVDMSKEIFFAIKKLIKNSCILLINKILYRFYHYFI